MLALVVSVPAGEVELAADSLWSMGVLAVEERRPAETESGVVELWTSLGEDRVEVGRAMAGMRSTWPWRLVEVDETTVDSWREHAGPTWITDEVVVVPAWSPFDAPAGVRPVLIEPGETFGMGDHPTTVLTARALLAALHPGNRVLDVGCGSGVLSVIAALAGAASVAAVDIHPAAVPVTVANAAANGVADRIEVGLTRLDEFEEPFDLVVANILAPALIELAPELIRLCGRTGTLVISGILATRHDHVVAALGPLVVVEQLELDGWCALVMRH